MEVFAAWEVDKAAPWELHNQKSFMEGFSGNTSIDGYSPRPPPASEG